MLEVEYAQELPSLFHTDQFSGQPQPPNYNFYLIWGLLLIFIVNNRYYDNHNLLLKFRARRTCLNLDYLIKIQ